MDSAPNMNLPTYSYPAVNLSIYAPNHTGKCMVSFYDHNKTFDDSKVYIVDINRYFELNLYDEKLMHLETVPPPGVVFLVDFGSDGLHRVVCNGNNSLYFIDSGEVMQMSSDLKIVSLSNRAQKMSARGIPCKVIEVLDEFEHQIYNLHDILYQQIWFTVHHIDEGHLVVTLRKRKPVEVAEPKEKCLQFTQEELDMLYEEPELVTTNALKAVLHYIPQDERRICPHFNPRTGRCFKGNSCHLEHVAILNDGTRDRKDAKHKMLQQSLPIVGSTVKVCVTCIVSAAEFYVHIPEIAARMMTDSLGTLKQKMNADNMVEQYRSFGGIPDLQDLVLVKVKDTFYRGKVIDVFEDRSAILFVDYGSVTLVHFKDIFQWHPRWDTTPALAYRCFLVNVQTDGKNDDAATNALRSLILNGSSVSAEIISCAEDLYVRLIDDNGFDVGDTLCANGFAQQAQRLVPISTQFPG